MRTWVCFRLGDGRVVELEPGATIGRSLNCDLCIADPWLSEAHAFVSLRDGALKLLSLRGRFELHGHTLTELVLRKGSRIRLTEVTELEVIEVAVPDSLLRLGCDGGPTAILTRTISLFGGQSPRIEAGAVPAADAVVWSDGRLWFMRLESGTVSLVPGQVVEVAGSVFRVSELVVGEAGGHTPGRMQPEGSLRLVVRVDTVHIHRVDKPVAALDGKVARIVSELATAGVPVDWQTLALKLWPNVTAPEIQRRNWDAAMARLRRKLRQADVRTDLVRSDYAGNFELKLGRDDVVVDET